MPIVRIEARMKRLYRISQKIKKQSIELEQIYDFTALRILTTSVRDCYAALGMIHNLWSPIPGRIKDFIAIARPNGYQSLHTSVIGAQGEPFEVQIRTLEMHNMAEEGIAAHWKYKEGSVGDQRDERSSMAAAAARVAAGGPGPAGVHPGSEAGSLPRGGLHVHPEGGGQALPRGATPVDFAYAIHTDVGHRCVGARMNGKWCRCAPAEERRHRRDHHADDAQAQPRLADFRGHRARTEQDPAFRAGEEKAIELVDASSRRRHGRSA